MEPMSAWKWNRLYQVSQKHRVTPWIADGIRKCQGDFFLQLPATLLQQFMDDNTERIEEYEHQELTNPILNRRLQQIIQSTDPDDVTLILLQNIIAIAKTMLSRGVSLRQFTMMGIYLRRTKDPIRYEQLTNWLATLGLGSMARLEASLLVKLFNFTPNELLFAQASSEKGLDHIVDDLFNQKSPTRYLRYYPREALTNYTAHIIHNIVNVEE